MLKMITIFLMESNDNIKKSEISKLKFDILRFKLIFFLCKQKTKQ